MVYAQAVEAGGGVGVIDECGSQTGMAAQCFGQQAVLNCKPAEPTQYHE
jgi:hypothetical protein